MTPEFKKVLIWQEIYLKVFHNSTPSNNRIPEADVLQYALNQLHKAENEYRDSIEPMFGRRTA